ncbi:MAG: hypothetical protein QM479_17050, partial [Pseudomonadota bacterium]
IRKTMIRKTMIHKTTFNQQKKEHNKTLNKFALEKLMQQTVGVCFNCHSLRYVRSLFENGERMLEIAQKKLNEAQQLINNTTQQYTIDDLSEIKKQYKLMQKHYHNVSLGIAHQSPDYQWWHGQPAMDGDLLKIKSLISDLQRKAKINRVQNNK